MFAVAMSVPASIPSPPVDSLMIGPLSIRAYGLMIAIGAAVAAAWAGRRLAAAGHGSSDDMSVVASWALVSGIVGARLYHVATAWPAFSGDLPRILRIWEGGLGIPGGLLLGTVGGLIGAHRRQLSTVAVLDAVAPAVPLAQAIGRWGNWWNQELFGRPTRLPWALQIDEVNAPADYAGATGFHPTFLYESLWNVAVAVGVVWLGHRWTSRRPGHLFVVYLVGYFTGRFWIEGLRIDRAHVIGGLRLNQWVALIVVGVGLEILVTARRRRLRGTRESVTDLQAVP